MEIPFTLQNKKNVSKALDGIKSYRRLTKEEWHQYVQNNNYDFDDSPLIWLIKKKSCDKGTALCLYWHLCPSFYCNPENTIHPDSRYFMVKEIEQKFVSGFYESELFSFDPQKVFLTSETDTTCIPKIMQEKTKGVEFERIEVEFAFLRNPNEKEKNLIQKRITSAISIVRKNNPKFEHKNPRETIIEIINYVEFWKEKDQSKLKITTLSYLWLDCVRKEYNWNWVIWDWVSGNKIGLTSESKALTCLSDIIIDHTIEGVYPTSIMMKLFEDINGANNIRDIKEDVYSGYGLLKPSEHLDFED